MTTLCLQLDGSYETPVLFFYSENNSDSLNRPPYTNLLIVHCVTNISQHINGLFSQCDENVKQNMTSERLFSIKIIYQSKVSMMFRSRVKRKTMLIWKQRLGNGPNQIMKKKNKKKKNFKT